MKKTINIKLLSALLLIAVSVCSLFISVISYTPPFGREKTYALQDLLDGRRFSEEVLSNYTGDFYVAVGNWALVLLCVLAVSAIAASCVGIVIMSKQKPVKWPYIMTILGVVGTAIPSLAVFTVVLISYSAFEGSVGLGIYPIVTPIAMICCLIIVIAERRRYMKKINASKLAGDLIHPAGDL